MLVPSISAAIAADGVDAAFVLAAITMLVMPIALGALGVRQLRRQPRLPEVAVTITPVTVLFPAVDRPSALAPQIRAEEWTREGSRAASISASGLHAVRVEFTRQDGGTRRRRSIAAGGLDVDVQVIVDALRSPYRFIAEASIIHHSRALPHLEPLWRDSRGAGAGRRHGGVPSPL